MALDTRDCTLLGPALPGPFVEFELEQHLQKRKLLPRASKALDAEWTRYRRKLGKLGTAAGERRVFNHVLALLAEPLGYREIERAEPVRTREGAEDGGWRFTGGRATDDDGTEHPVALRCWALPVETDLDAPNRRGRAYRFSPARIAERVLLAAGERVGLLTNGDELRVVLCDPARRESHITIPLHGVGGWSHRGPAPDSYRLLKALCCPAGTRAVPELTEAARLAQTGVTDQLRVQARRAIEGFVQAVIEHDDNRDHRAGWHDPDAIARQLWSEGLVLVYRLLFTLKLETDPDPARAFSFASHSLWRRTYSPNQALAPIVERVKRGEATGRFLEDGLRTLFGLFSTGLESAELTIAPLGGMLFGPESTPLLDALRWGEHAVATLLEHLLWTPGGRTERERVHYGALSVENLGRVYEALLELESGIATEPMCRLRRGKLEVVVPAAQGSPYRDRRSSKSRVEWVEDIAEGRFYLRVGLGRKASGSYYTPEPFVKFLVEETLRPQIEALNSTGDPRPVRLLGLKVLDPAMGSGHFLVEACRYLGDALYEACRLCDERAAEAMAAAEASEQPEDAARLIAEAEAWWDRIRALPDPDDALMSFLPSRVAEGERSGYSQPRAEAMCRRMAAVHCLYGVDKNRLAVELARVALWLESYAEGLPLTFLDHRLICGDSLTGPFFDQLITSPGSGETAETLFVGRLQDRLRDTLAVALEQVRALEATVGKSIADLAAKQAAKARLDAALAPFVTLARAWTGGVMLGSASDDTGYGLLLRAVADGEDPAGAIAAHPSLAEMLAVGAEAVPYDLTFAEVFHPGGDPARIGGFDAVVGNPPWDAIQFKSKEFLAAFDLSVLDAPTKRERTVVEERLLADEAIEHQYREQVEAFEQMKRVNDRLYAYQKVIIDGDLAGRQLDAFRVFMERNVQVLGPGSYTGVLVPAAFHANAGATGVRRLYLDQMALHCCFSFENRRKLFEIDSRFKFATVVAHQDPAGTRAVRCAFYLHDMDWLFAEGRGGMMYSRRLTEVFGGAYANLPEFSSVDDLTIAQALADGPACSVAEALELNAIRVRMTELHTTHDADRFSSSWPMPSGLDPRSAVGALTLMDNGCFILYEGKLFHQFDAAWGEPPRYCVPVERLAARSEITELARYFRFALRKIARSNDERTSIVAVMPPGAVFADNTISECAPQSRRSCDMLAFVAVFNGFVYDWLLRVKVASTVSVFFVKQNLFPPIEHIRRFLAHAALRLTCNHAGYAPLWTEQVGDAWREPTPRHTWPVLAGDDARWAVRAAIDAVVADAYGLDRAQYAHVLSTFSHKSYPEAPARCLAAFDELRALGLDAFARRHDPYHDLPLVESLPQPVIDLPGAETATAADGTARLVEASGQIQLLAPDNGPLFRNGGS